MLITRPFTNQEVADRIEIIGYTAGFQREHAGALAEACRRLRGQAGSGESERPEADPGLLKAYAGWASKFAEAHGYTPSAFDAWRDSRGSTIIGLPVIDPDLLDTSKEAAC
jgi:hypothetical protein